MKLVAADVKGQEVDLLRSGLLSSFYSLNSKTGPDFFFKQCLNML